MTKTPPPRVPAGGLDQIAPHMGPGGSLTMKLFDSGQLGHQDSLIGTRDATAPVFKEILDFLHPAAPAGADHAA